MSSGAELLDPVAGTITQYTVPWDMFCNGTVDSSLRPAFYHGRHGNVRAHFCPLFFGLFPIPPLMIRQRELLPASKTWRTDAGIRPLAVLGGWPGNGVLGGSDFGGKTNPAQTLQWTAPTVLSDIYRE